MSKRRGGASDAWAPAPRQKQEATKAVPPTINPRRSVERIVIPLMKRFRSRTARIRRRARVLREGRTWKRSGSSKGRRVQLAGWEDLARVATLEGFEPSISTLKGWRAGPLHHRVGVGRTQKSSTRVSGGPGEVDVGLVGLRAEQGTHGGPGTRGCVHLDQGAEDESAAEEQQDGGDDLNQEHGSLPPGPAYEKVRPDQVQSFAYSSLFRKLFAFGARAEGPELGVRCQ